MVRCVVETILWFKNEIFFVNDGFLKNPKPRSKFWKKFLKFEFDLSWFVVKMILE